MRIGVVPVLMLLVGGIASAQYDPGIRDSVSFGPWEAIVPADSPWAGSIRIPVRVFNDEFLKGIVLAFEYTGPWKAISVTFYGNRAKYFNGGEVDIHITPFVLIRTPYSNYPLIPPDSGVLCYLCFSVEDIGEVTMDKGFHPFGWDTYFSDDLGRIDPQFLSLQDRILLTDLTAGDVNADGFLNLADIVALANYVFRFSYRPPIMNLCDVNADCKVNIVDVVYLINVILRGRFTARFGCVC